MSAIKLSATTPSAQNAQRMRNERDNRVDRDRSQPKKRDRISRRIGGGSITCSFFNLSRDLPHDRKVARNDHVSFEKIELHANGMFLTTDDV